MIRILDLVSDWAMNLRPAVESAGLVVELHHSPPDRDDPAAWIDIDSPDRLVRLTVWASGETTLSGAHVTTGEILDDQHRHISDRFGLEQVLDEAVAWVTSGP